MAVLVIFLAGCNKEDTASDVEKPQGTQMATEAANEEASEEEAVEEVLDQKYDPFIEVTTYRKGYDPCNRFRRRRNDRQKHMVRCL